MHSLPRLRSQAALQRSGLAWMLAMVLWAGLLGAWNQAQAATPPAGDNELAYFILQEQAEETAITEQADSAWAELSCRKPAPFKTSVADLVLNLVADKDVLSREDALWLALPHAAPAQRPSPALPQIEREPLLRPPAQLG